MAGLLARNRRAFNADTRGSERRKFFSAATYCQFVLTLPVARKNARGDLLDVGAGDVPYREYFADPNRRWPWLAQATVIAKHELKDLPLARKFAVALQQNTTDPNVPVWVKQMEPFILEDMGELEMARILIGGLLASGQVKDRRDAEMLERRLHRLEERLKQKPK